MKQLIVLLTLIVGGLSVFAQKTKVREARDYLADQNYKKAIVVIEEAVANEETKNSADAWYLRGMAYLQKALDTTVLAPEAAGVSYNSLMKALAIQPDYGTEINNALYSHALLTFNEGVSAYSKNDYNAAYSQFVKVVTIYNVGDGKRFAGDKGFTDLIISAKTNAAYAAFTGRRDNDALALLTDLKNTSGSKDSTIYQTIIEINQRQNNEVAALTTINEARRTFPSNTLFRDMELNYYIKAGKPEVLLSKLEEAVKGDPKNTELLYNLGNIYERIAYPKDEAGKALSLPANFTDMFSKAETAYRNAIAGKPTNPDYNYNLAILYYESATDITRQMNNIKGMSAEENKKYDALLADRNALFTKALPYFQTAYSTLDARASTLTKEEKITYQNAMIGMREIYSRNDNKAKVDELQAKITALQN